MTITKDDTKPFIAKKPLSPFNVDPHNNRGGKRGNKGQAPAGGGSKMKKSITTRSVKGGGSGGDR